MNAEWPKIFVSIGLILIFAGLILYYFPSFLTWFGKLPGDIRIERKSFSFYFPITSMIIITLLVQFIIWMIGYFKLKL